MDNRIIITKLLQCDVGDMYLVRNAGNLVPHGETVTFDAVSTEPGALELGCVMNSIPNVLVCGHSDCKVMSL
jgi:carbonic anhydrase